MHRRPHAKLYDVKVSALMLLTERRSAIVECNSLLHPASVGGI